MTKDKNVYTTPLQVLPDPRATHSAADRKAQFDLAMKLYEHARRHDLRRRRINGVRLALDERAAKLPQTTLRKRLHARVGAGRRLRKKIVATKEGGMITGEERLRENLADLYGNVIFYEGRPSRAEFARTRRSAEN